MELLVIHFKDVNNNVYLQKNLSHVRQPFQVMVLICEPIIGLVSLLSLETKKHHKNAGLISRGDDYYTIVQVTMGLQTLSLTIVRKFARQSITRVHGAVATRYMSTSPWANFDMAPLDPIVGLNETFAQDDFPQKVIVGVGAYRDDTGKPYGAIPSRLKDR